MVGGMAAVDSLLRLIAVRNAELLVIASGQVPQLRRAGETAALSMPALEARLVNGMVEEVLDEVAKARLSSTGTAETRYAATLYVPARANTLEGSPKIPAPMIELITSATRSHCRRPRTNRASGACSICIGFCLA